MIDTGLCYHSSFTVFNNCRASTSVWFGRLHQKLAVTVGDAPSRLSAEGSSSHVPRAYSLPGLMLDWNGPHSLLLSLSVTFQICVYFPKYSVGVRFWSKINLNFSSRQVAYIFSVSSLLSKLYKKLQNLQISLDHAIYYFIVIIGILYKILSTAKSKGQYRNHRNYMWYNYTKCM